jgi:hypothetical protein
LPRPFFAAGFMTFFSPPLGAVGGVCSSSFWSRAPRASLEAVYAVNRGADRMLLIRPSLISVRYRGL